MDESDDRVARRLPVSIFSGRHSKTGDDCTRRLVKGAR